MHITAAPWTGHSFFAIPAGNFSAVTFHERHSTAIRTSRKLSGGIIITVHHGASVALPHGDLIPKGKSPGAPPVTIFHFLNANPNQSLGFRALLQQNRCIHSTVDLHLVYPLLKYGPAGCGSCRICPGSADAGHHIR